MTTLIIKRKGKFASMKSIAHIDDKGVYLVEVVCKGIDFYSVMKSDCKLQFVSHEGLSNYVFCTSLSKNVKYGVSDTNMMQSEELEQYAKKQIDTGMVFCMEDEPF